MSKTDQNSEFRGLTIFELLAICAVILGAFLWALSARSNLTNQKLDIERKARVSTLKENLKTYVVANNSFPSDEQFQDEKSRGEIFKTFLIDQGSDALNDPKETSKLISYSAEPEGCAPGTDTICTKVSVGLKLSTGDLFIKFAVKPGEEIKYLKEAAQSGNSNEQNILKSVQDQTLGD